MAHARRRHGKLGRGANRAHLPCGTGFQPMSPTGKMPCHPRGKRQVNGVGIGTCSSTEAGRRSHPIEHKIAACPYLCPACRPL